MDILTLRHDISLQLQAKSESPALDAELLIAHVLDQNRSWLLSHLDYELNELQFKNLQEKVAARLRGKPIAYILGYKEFWSLSLEVNEHVLIPRPETEIIVETSLQLFPNALEISCADLATGSGAIAIALAKEREKWQIYASDISKEALCVAKKNASINGASNIQFLESNWFEAYPDIRFDLICSNPPYISKDDPYLSDLSYEPYSALVAEEDGLNALKRVIGDARNYLKPNGYCMVEHGALQAKQVESIFRDAGYHKIELYFDYNHLPRVTCAQFN